MVSRANLIKKQEEERKKKALQQAIKAAQKAASAKTSTGGNKKTTSSVTTRGGRSKKATANLPKASAKKPTSTVQKTKGTNEYKAPKSRTPGTFVKKHRLNSGTVRSLDNTVFKRGDNLAKQTAQNLGWQERDENFYSDNTKLTKDKELHTKGVLDDEYNRIKLAHPELTNRQIYEYLSDWGAKQGYGEEYATQVAKKIEESDYTDVIRKYVDQYGETEGLKQLQNNLAMQAPDERNQEIRRLVEEYLFDKANKADQEGNTELAKEYRMTSRKFQDATPTDSNMGKLWQATSSGFGGAVAGLGTVATMGNDNFEDAVHTYQQQQLVAKQGAGALGGAVLDIANVMGMQVPALLTGGAGGMALMGVSSAGQKYVNAIDNGATQQEAVTTAVATGLLEGIAFALPIKAIRTLKRTPKAKVTEELVQAMKETTLFKSIAQKAAKGAGAEILSEGLTAFASDLADEIIYTDNIEKAGGFLPWVKQNFGGWLYEGTIGGTFGAMAGAVAGTSNYYQAQNYKANLINNIVEQFDSANGITDGIANAMVQGSQTEGTANAIVNAANGIKEMNEQAKAKKIQEVQEVENMNLVQEPVYQQVQANPASTQLLDLRKNPVASVEDIVNVVINGGKLSKKQIELIVGNKNALDNISRETGLSFEGMNKHDVIREIESWLYSKNKDNQENITALEELDENRNKNREISETEAFYDELFKDVPRFGKESDISNAKTWSLIDVVDVCVAGGKVSRKQMTALVNSRDARNAFTEKTGVSLQGVSNNKAKQLIIDWGNNVVPNYGLPNNTTVQQAKKDRLDDADKERLEQWRKDNSPGQSKTNIEQPPHTTKPVTETKKAIPVTEVPTTVVETQVPANQPVQNVVTEPQKIVVSQADYDRLSDYEQDLLDRIIDNDFISDGDLDDIADIYPDLMVVLRKSTGNRNIKTGEDIRALMDGKLEIKPRVEKPKASQPKAKETKLVEPEANNNPEKDATRNRNYPETALENPSMTEEIEGNIRDRIERGEFKYVVQSNAELVDDVSRDLDGLDLESARQRVLGRFEGGKLPSSKDIAAAEVVLTKAISEGNSEVAEELIIEIAQAGTELGRAVQAMSLIKKLSPAGRLLAVEKAVKKVNKKIAKNPAGKKIELPKELRDKILFAKTQEEIDSAMHEAAVFVGENTPATLGDKFDAWRYLAMLANPRTHIRNLFGNLLMFGGREMNNLLSGVIQDAFVKSGKTRTAKKPTKEQKEFAEAQFVDAKDAIMVGGKYGLDFEISEHRKIFETKWLESLRKKNMEWLGGSDAIFMKPAFTKALAGYMRANDYTPEFLKQNEVEYRKAVDFAILEAQRATYREANALANGLRRLEAPKGKSESLDAVKKVAIGGTLPFKKTPLNIAKRSLEYSPFGVAKGIKKMQDRAKELEARGETNIEVGEVIDCFTEAATGSSAIMLGAFLAAIGCARGSGSEENDERYYKQDLGVQDYSIQLGGGYSLTMDWATPLSVPFFMGVELYEGVNSALEGEGKEVLPAIINAVLNAGEPIIEMSCLQGVMNAIQSNSGDTPTEQVLNIFSTVTGNFAGQFIPTLFGQTARTLDSTRRNTYTASESAVASKGIDTWVKKQLNKIPGLSQLNEPYVDKWGREDDGGGIGFRFFENMLSPGYIAKRKDSAVDTEIQRLYDATGENALIPKSPNSTLTYEGKDYYLSGEEYTKYKQEYGRMAYTALNEIVGTDVYKNASEVDKEAVFEACYEYAKETSIEKYLKGKNVVYEKETWITNAQAKGISVTDAIKVKALISHTCDDFQADGIKNGKKKKIAAYLREVDVPDSLKDYYWSIGSNGKAYTGDWRTFK